MTRNMSITCLRANTSRRIKQSSGWPLSLQSQTISHGDCRVCMHLWYECEESYPRSSARSQWILTETVEETRFYWNPSHSAWPWLWRANRESHSKMWMWWVSTQQRPSTQITLFERTRQSAWLDAVKTPIDRKRVNSCFWGSSSTNRQKTLGMLSSTRY